MVLHLEANPNWECSAAYMKIVCGRWIWFLLFLL